MASIVWEIRWPRTLGAFAVGAALGLAGGMAQGLFRNPLADPFLLGSSGGAALGVAVGLALGLEGAGLSSSLMDALGLTGAAFVGSLLAVLLTLVVARGAAHTHQLLLAGIVTSVVWGALTQAMTLTWPSLLRPMQTFMLGDTALLGWTALALLGPVVAMCAALAWTLAPTLDALVLGEDHAISLGIPLGWTRSLLVMCLALASGAAVAQAGLIAFVGLVAPHMVRAWGLRGYRQRLMASGFVGGLLLQASDLLARSVSSAHEWPVGLVTALLGASYLLFLMQRRRS